MRLLVLLLVVLLAGCAGLPNLSATKGAQFAHADMQAAAAYATKNGFPARAAMWTAIDAQVTACENAISAAAPAVPTVTGAAMALEVGAEALSTGIPAAVSVNCAPIPLVAMPVIPKL